MTIALAWWLVLGAGTVGAAALAPRRPRPAARLAVATFAVLLVAVAASPPQRHDGTEAAFPARDLLAAAPPVHDAPKKAATAPQEVAPARDEASRPRPAALVRAFYAALDAKDFATAWDRLSPTVRTSFGGFAAWSAGYATTLGHEVADLHADGRGVTHTLVASDRTPCGGVTTRSFRVTWRFAGQRAAALSAVKLGGIDPASAC